MLDCECQVAGAPRLNQTQPVQHEAANDYGRRCCVNLGQVDLDLKYNLEYIMKRDLDQVIPQDLCYFSDSCLWKFTSSSYFLKSAFSDRGI